MAYTRKTEDLWVIQGNYGQGWEDVSAYKRFDEARADKKAYRENEPQYPHRLVFRRVAIAGAKRRGTAKPNHRKKAR